MKKRIIIKLMYAIFAAIVIVANFVYADIIGPKSNKDKVTKGPLYELQTPTHMPDIIRYGWYKSKDDKWYYLDGASRPTIGWHHDDYDGMWYYFDQNGEMVTGWKKIGDKEYYFSEQIASNNWVYDNDLCMYFAKDKGIKSNGALYMNEYTPDGHFVDENGVKVR